MAQYAKWKSERACSARLYVVLGPCWALRASLGQGITWLLEPFCILNVINPKPDSNYAALNGSL